MTPTTPYISKLPFHAPCFSHSHPGKVEISTVSHETLDITRYTPPILFRQYTGMGETYLSITSMMLFGFFQISKDTISMQLWDMLHALSKYIKWSGYCRRTEVELHEKIQEKIKNNLIKCVTISESYCNELRTLVMHLFGVDDGELDEEAPS